jgi:hypothetical protein
MYWVANRAEDVPWRAGAGILFRNSPGDCLAVPCELSFRPTLLAGNNRTILLIALMVCTVNSCLYMKSSSMSHINSICQRA